MNVYDAKNEEFDFFSSKYLNINSCGKLFNTGYAIRRINGRSDYHLLYVKSGRCDAVYDGKRYNLSDGNFVIYYPHQTQEYSFDTDGCTTYWMHFSGRAAKEILSELQIEPGAYRCKLPDNAAAMFEELIREFHLKHYMHNSAENALLIYLLTILSRYIHAVHNTNDIERVIMLMNIRYDVPYDSQSYAKICALSKSRFSHKFKEVTGDTPSRYFIGIKIDKACELLKFSNLSLSEIAEKIGYDNALYFSRIFKKYMHLSPTEYRTKSKQKESAAK